MTDCERTSLYFDGELAEAEEAAALAHLAGCGHCQAALGDWMGLEVALSRRRAAAAPAAPPRRRRWPWLGGAVLAAAASAAVALLWLRGPDVPAIALAETRPLEVRFTAPVFDRHRVYRVSRDGAAHEQISLEAMAALERSDPDGLVAAHALSGNLARARDALDRRSRAPDGIDRRATPAHHSDTAAVALAAGDPAAALAHADAALAAAPQLAQARWNRALALQALGLPLAAAAELDQVAQQREPGWSDEAGQRAAALREPVQVRMRELAAYQAAAAAMVAGTGPALGAAQASRHPGLARRDLYDALAAAGSADEARALAPLAAELDRLAGNDAASRAVAEVAGRDFAVRRRFQARYRALVTGALDGRALTALIDELAKAGEPASDILVAAILQAPPTAADQARLARLPDQPWLAIQRAWRDGELRTRAGDVFGAEQALLAAVAACREPAWALPCGKLERDLGALYLRMRRLDEADAHLRAASAAFVAGGAFQHADHVLTRHVNLERLRQRDRVAAAYLDEFGLRTPGRCDNLRFVDDSHAAIAFETGDVAAARARLPEPDRCGQPPSAARLHVAVDLARLAGPPPGPPGGGPHRPDSPSGDLARARAQIAAARGAPGSSGVAATIGSGRLRIDTEPAAGADEVRQGLAAVATLAAEPGTAGELRAWGYATLIGDAGARHDWPAALAAFAEELGGPAPAGCLVAVSSDNERTTAVARGTGAALHGSHVVASELPGRATLRIPDALVAALAGCPAIAVIARPPLHGSAALLPAALPWAFVGHPQRGAPAPRPPRSVIVSDARPPRSLGLPPLGGVTAPGATLLTGGDAAPGRVLTALRDATYVELHAHGIVDASEAAFVALSPEPDGAFALTAAQVQAARLDGAPVVVLAACHGARTATRYLATRWSLPDAFLAAGARAVIAVSTAIPEDQGAALFGELRSRLARGEPPVQAVAALRAARLAQGQAWAAGLMVFE